MDPSRDRHVLAAAQLDGGLVGAVAGPAVARGPVGDGFDRAVERLAGVQVAFPHEEPEAPNWPQYRISSTNQLPIGMDNEETTAHGQYRVGVGAKNAREMVQK